MKRRIHKNQKLVLASLPAIVVGCALATQGDPPPPVLDPVAGEGGEAQTGGTGTTGGMGTGGTGVSGAGGSSSGTSGAESGGSTSTGGSAGSTSTGGSAGQGGTAGSATGGAGGMTGGSAGKGGSAGSATGGSGGMTGGSAGKGGSAGSATGGSAGKGGSAGSATGGSAGGPPSGMELLRENFEMGTSAWTMTPSGVWSTSMDGTTVLGSMGATGSSAMRSAAAGELTWTDVQIDARVKVTSFAGTSSGYYAGICARYQSTSSYACFALRSNGQVMFRVGSNNTGAANAPLGAIQEGAWYNVRVVARGANITAFIGTSMATMAEIPAGSRVTSGAPTSGRIALACPGTNAVFDDIVVTTP